jgi:hypothetical protein
MVDIDLTRPIPQRLRRDPQLAPSCGGVFPLLLNSATASWRNSFEYGPDMDTIPLDRARNALSAQVSTKAGELHRALGRQSIDTR